MTEYATAALLNWRRPANIPRIVTHLLSHEFIKLVHVFDNSRQLDARQFTGMPVVVLRDDGIRANRKCYGRFLAAQCAPTDWVVSIDDDYICHNWNEIWEKAHRRPEVVTAGMMTNEKHGGLIPRLGLTWDIMLGYGSCFLKKHIDLLDKYVSKWGMDDVFEEQTDRIFACLFGQKHQVVKAEVSPLPGHDSYMSMHKVPEHKGVVEIARQRAAEIIRDELLTNKRRPR